MVGVSRSALVGITIGIVCYSVYMLMFGGFHPNHEREHEQRQSQAHTFVSLKRLMEAASPPTGLQQQPTMPIPPPPLSPPPPPPSLSPPTQDGGSGALPDVPRRPLVELLQEAAAPPSAPPTKPPSVPPTANQLRRRRPPTPPPAATKRSPLPHAAPTAPDASIGLPKLAADRSEWCHETRKRYNVQPLKSWGQLPASLMETWRSRGCDSVFTAARLTQRPVTTCPPAPAAAPDAPALPLIAVMAATTTRKVAHPSTETLSLFTLLLPSLVRSLDCGFRYVYVLGYDKGDPFYDSEAGMGLVKRWFHDHVEAPMAANNVALTLLLVKVNNSVKKPGPVFIAMARAAFELGAAFFYRINDDTEITAHWPALFVQAVSSLPPPFGVVGPTCTQGNNRILTHDFVSRTHMEVFEMNYYPPELSDWWMDDWISLVYGQRRTFRSNSATVHHHTGAHGQRYQVDPSHEGLLDNLIVTGALRSLLISCRSATLSLVSCLTLFLSLSLFSCLSRTPL